MPELGVIPSVAGAAHVHPFGWKLYVGANKTDRKYGRLDRNFKAKRGNWVFCFTNLFLFYQLIFVVKILLQLLQAYIFWGDDFCAFVCINSVCAWKSRLLIQKTRAESMQR